jgi:hypothetical protein
MKPLFGGLTIGSLITAWFLWTFGAVSPKTGPYWTFYAASAVVWALLYVGTEDRR